jgi:hypothetical protein
VAYARIISIRQLIRMRDLNLAAMMGKSLVKWRACSLLNIARRLHRIDKININLKKGWNSLLLKSLKTILAGILRQNS